MLRRKKKRPLLRRPVFWITFLLAIAAFSAAWWLWHGLYAETPRLNFVLIKANGEPQKILSGEALSFSPKDKIEILNISTNIPFNLGVRLVSNGIDAGALIHEEMTLSSLLSAEEVFSYHNVRVHIKQNNNTLGYMDWKIQPHAEDWLDKADRTISKERKIAILENAIKILPNDSRFQRRLINELKSLEKWKQASLLLEKLANKKPSQEMLQELLDVYTAMSDKKSIILVLKRMIKQDPEDIQTRTMLAEIYDNEGKLEKAIKEYNAILGRVHGNDKILLYKRLGYLYTQVNHFEKAISVYRKAADLDRNDVNLFYNLSYLYEKLNKRKKADFYLDKALSLKMDDVEGRLKLADSLVERGELDEAEKHLSYVLEKRPNSLDALLTMMQVAEKKDRKPELKKIYEKIHSLDPKNETIIYNLGVLEYEEGRFEKSLPYFKRYLKSHPNESNLREILFDIYKRTNNRKMALEEALVLLELKPENMDTYHYVAESFIKKEDYKKTIPLMEKGLKINPEATELREYLLLSYLKTGNDEGAITQMIETLKRNPKNIELWLHVAKLLEKNERYDEASEAYKNIIDLSPGHEEAEEAYLRLRLKGVQGEGKT